MVSFYKPLKVYCATIKTIEKTFSKTSMKETYSNYLNILYKLVTWWHMLVTSATKEVRARG